MLTLIAAVVAPAAAQELCVGYQVQHFSSDGSADTIPLGFSGSVAGPVSGPVSLVGEVDWSRKGASETRPSYAANFVAWGGGARWSGRSNPSVTPFVEGLVRAMRISTTLHSGGLTFDGGSETHVMLQLGGGVSFPAGRAIGAFGQFDYRRVFADIPANGLRFVVGVRLTIG